MAAPAKQKRLVKFVNMYKSEKQSAIVKYSGRPAPAKKQSLFRTLDVDKDGYLTKQELSPFAKRIGIKLASLMRRMDKNNNNKVSRAEFRAFMRNILS